jgi:hypothetical protein
VTGLARATPAVIPLLVTIPIPAAGVIVAAADIGIGGSRILHHSSRRILNRSAQHGR